MLNNASGFRKVYIAAGYTDLRRGIDGLASIVKFNFQLDPYEYSCAGVPLFRRNGYRQSGGREPLFRNRDTALNDCCLRVYWLKAGSNPYTSRMDL